MLLLNNPDPPSSIVRHLFTVGSNKVSQQIPLETTGDPPSEVIFPPEVADVYDISVTVNVLTVGRPGSADLSFLQELNKLIERNDRNNPAILSSYFIALKFGSTIQRIGPIKILLVGD
jgi:hypothetical protein